MIDVKTMSDEELEQKIKNIMKESFGLDFVKSDADFVNDLKIDSITRMELLLKLEDEFGVRVEDKDAQNMNSVNSTVKMIKAIISAF